MTNINQISSTGNHIVDAIGKINITGNIIPEAWYKTIQKTRKHPYLHAIILLSEIAYWYRPKELCDEATGERTYKKKFAADLWQVSMSTLSDKFGLSKDQVRAALDFLEVDIQVIKRHYRTIDSRTGKLSNVLYIELIPDVLMNLTYPESWIIACIKDGYYEKKANKPTKKIDHGFKERDYDWDKLEAELFNQNP